ncbi:phosphoribosylanthranilate isomerase [Piscibacillus salipiscarius]|uniref:N-(5'-phosphoribosyl)anthranilate isomerase n=1 Tax=Piscibacillus salipiscarius TaxID=299480 RepID=A0ABW5Q7N4_9BACI|nr:phosphoribosylanthranilate isomerase [Piscibacillus salipiscarius]
MTQVKICGIKKLNDAMFAANAGADAIGFVFAESKRRMSIEQAANIAMNIPDHVKKIGVFVNPSRIELEETYQQVGLDYVQLHGNESPEFCESLSLPFIKALRVSSDKDLRALKTYEKASYFLLDSATGPYQGGNGTTFGWELLKDQKINRSKLILAGGLNEDNVKTAINQSTPVMVDVSSGVETNGQKDPIKIKQFIQNVKERSTCHTHNL